ncbi:hypothetical protein ACHQM5_019965 [Ranunculus cassubicifolius]
MDRLSYLPDQIRNLIFSFLPTEDAIRSRILSTEWRYTCSSLSKLVFNQYQGESLDNKLRKKFKEFVNQTLVPEETDIERISVYVDVDEEVIFSLDLNRWISIAVQRNVKELCIWAVSSEPQKLPRCFFTCATLKNLALHNIKFQFPDKFRFPMLNHLTLGNVVFCGHGMEKLLSTDTCPVLEELVVLYCYQSNSIITYHPRIRYLKLFTRNYCDAFKLSIPSLREIDYSGIPLKVCSRTLYSLAKATFQFDTMHYNPPYPGANLAGLNNLHTLTLKPYFFEFLSLDRNLPAIASTLSFRLKHFRCHVFPTENHYQMVFFMLDCLEGLETLGINVEELPRDEEEIRYLKKKYQPKSALRRILSFYPALKRVEIRNCAALETELFLVSTIFNGGNVCEEVHISFSKSMDSIVRNKAIKYLSSMDRYGDKALYIGVF